MQKAICMNTSHYLMIPTWRRYEYVLLTYVENDLARAWICKKENNVTPSHQLMVFMHFFITLQVANYTTLRIHDASDKEMSFWNLIWFVYEEDLTLSSRVFLNSPRTDKTYINKTFALSLFFTPRSISFITMKFVLKSAKSMTNLRCDAYIFCWAAAFFALEYG